MRERIRSIVKESRPLRIARRLYLPKCLEKLSEKGPEIAARYSTEHEKSISNRPIRCRVVLHRAPSAYPKAPGRSRVHTLREILDAIFYILRSGCAWRLLPHDFPP